jgi:hypothetical protein
MASSSRLPVHGSANNLKASWHLMEAGHASTSRESRGGRVEMDGLGGLGLKTTVQAGFPVCTSKPKARPVCKVVKAACLTGDLRKIWMVLPQRDI